MVLILGISFVAVLHWIPCFLISLSFCFLVYSLVYWNMSSVSFLRRGDIRSKVFETLNVWRYFLLHFPCWEVCLLISNFRLEMIIPQKLEALLFFFSWIPPLQHPQLPVLVGEKKKRFVWIPNLCYQTCFLPFWKLLEASFVCFQGCKILQDSVPSWEMITGGSQNI